MKKNYSELWHELKRWVDSGEGSLEEIISKTQSQEEIDRLRTKQNTLSMIHGKMNELEKSI